MQMNSVDTMCTGIKKYLLPTGSKVSIIIGCEFWPHYFIIQELLQAEQKTAFKNRHATVIATTHIVPQTDCYGNKISTLAAPVPCSTTKPSPAIQSSGVSVLNSNWAMCTLLKFRQFLAQDCFIRPKLVKNWLPWQCGVYNHWMTIQKPEDPLPAIVLCKYLV